MTPPVFIHIAFLITLAGWGATRLAHAETRETLCQKADRQERWLIEREGKSCQAVRHKEASADAMGRFEVAYSSELDPELCQKQANQQIKKLQSTGWRCATRVIPEEKQVSGLPAMEDTESENHPVSRTPAKNRP